MRYEPLTCTKTPADAAPADVEDWDTTAYSRKSAARPVWTIARQSIAHILAFLLVAVIAFDLGRGSAPRASKGHVMKTYGTDQRYMTLDKKFDHLWDRDHDLPVITLTAETTPDPAAIGTPGLIAMFHDLHCLSSMRTALQKAYYDEKPVLDFHDNDHWPHCMHHLRQSILCRADDTVEVMRWNNGTLGAPNISGVTDVRKCGSSDALFKKQAREVEAGRGVWDAPKDPSRS